MHLHAMMTLQLTPVTEYEEMIVALRLSYSERSKEAHRGGGVPGDVLFRSVGFVTTAGTFAEADCLPLGRGGGGRPSSTVL